MENSQIYSQPKICLFRSQRVKNRGSGGGGGGGARAFPTPPPPPPPPHFFEKVSQYYARLTVIKYLKSLSLRGIHPLGPTMDPKAGPWMLIWP